MQTAIIYPILCAAGYYLASQARITQALWSRYPPWIDSYLSCAACFGFALGVACGALGWWQHWNFLLLDGRDWLTPVIVALCSIVWTPIVARVHAEAMYVLGGGSSGSDHGDSV